MKVFSTLLMATLTLALVLVASASAATVGGGTAVTSPNGPDEFGRAWAACLETRDPNSDECYTAQELSGMGPDEFFDKLNRKLDFLAEQQPKAEKRPDAWALMKECAATRDLESDACRRFITATGLNGDEVARLADGLANPYGTDQQATADKKSNSAGMTETMKACVSLRGEMSGRKHVEELAALAEKINSVCPRAIKESKLTPGQFWSKFSAYK
jgi:hypothetical protein